MTDPTIGVIEYRFVLRRGQQALVALKGILAHATASAVLRRQTSTTFGATTSQHLTTVFGCHAGTETVYALTLQVAGLECSFHDTTALDGSRAGGFGKTLPYTSGKKRRNSKGTAGHCQSVVGERFFHNPQVVIINKEYIKKRLCLLLLVLIVSVDK